MALVIVTVVATGLVVANWGDKKVVDVSAGRATPAGGAVVAGGDGAGKGAVIGGLVGAGGGTLYGLNENQKHDESYRNSYAACMHSRGYRG